MNKIIITVREFFSPGTKSLPADGSGFKANFYIRSLRFISRSIINILYLNGRNRWSNEFIQALDPQITTKVFSGDSYPIETLTFRTGHGRLFWRATESVNLETETNEWIRTFTKNDVFYDVGANIGLYSMLASKCTNGEIKVIAIEPEPKNFSILNENLILNNIKNVVVMPVALAEKNFLAMFNISADGPGSAKNTIVEQKGENNVSNRSFAQLPTITFRMDWLIENFNLPIPTVVKIDVDGNELTILEGFGKYIDSVRSIVVEIKDGMEQEFINFFSSRNFALVKKGEYASETMDNRNYIFQLKSKS